MPKGAPKGRPPGTTTVAQDASRILEVSMNEDAHAALKAAATAVRLENKSALVRAFADAVRRKSVQELRYFLFMDD